jgi:3-methyladenine DNA glycosylase AlkD
MTDEILRKELERLGDAQQAAFLQKFFKTGPGQYGEGDRFRGIRVPVLRKLAKRSRGVPVEEALKLLRSPFHEDRLLALFLLVDLFSRSDESVRKGIYTAYLAHTSFVNNWDLVDSSAEHIVGAFLFNRDRKPLMTLAGADLLWERRIAIMSTFHFIKKGDFSDTLTIAERLLADKEDLIHKAVGWMIREVGKRDAAVEEDFLDRFCGRMPRTMLRYAIERFPEPKRLAYLHRPTESVKAT